MSDSVGILVAWPSWRFRNFRAAAELRWCRAILRNGGFEPDEWRQNDEGGGGTVEEEMTISS